MSTKCIQLFLTKTVLLYVNKESRLHKVIILFNLQTCGIVRSMLCDVENDTV